MNLVAEVAPASESQSDIQPVHSPELVRGEPFVHMHIPKTAGTSLRRVFEAEFGVENIVLPHDETGRIMRSSDRKYTVPTQLIGVCERTRSIVHRLGLTAPLARCMQTMRDKEAREAGQKMSDEDTLDFQVLLGHFTGDKIKSRGLDAYPVTTVVREPLERSISFYRHWQRTSGAAFGSTFGQKSVEDTKFEDIALHEELTNFQSRWIGGLPLASIGVVDKLDEFLASVGIRRPVVHSNRDPLQKDRPRLDPGLLRAFKDANADDYELYEQTLDAWS